MGLKVLIIFCTSHPPSLHRFDGENIEIKMEKMVEYFEGTFEC
jgi:hypothetical protein